MHKIEIAVKGITPLLMNRFHIPDLEEKPKKKIGESKEPPIENKLYLFKGQPYIPAIYFVRSLINAGKDFQIPKKGKATYSKVIGATVDVEPEALMITPSTWEIYRISGVNPNTKGRIMISRPRFDEWACTLTVTVEDDAISPATIEEILCHAGRRVGVGDWRPEKKGKFGKFMLAKFEEVG